MKPIRIDEVEEIHYFDCDCRSDEHTLKFTLITEDGQPELYTTIFLNQWRNIIKRIWIAAKYILGYKCKYGHFDCWELDPINVGRMILMLEKYRTLLNKWANK